MSFVVLFGYELVCIFETICKKFTLLFTQTSVKPHHTVTTYFAGLPQDVVDIIKRYCIIPFDCQRKIYQQGVSYVPRFVSQITMPAVFAFKIVFNKPTILVSLLTTNEEMLPRKIYKLNKFSEAFPKHWQMHVQSFVWYFVYHTSTKIIGRLETPDKFCLVSCLPNKNLNFCFFDVEKHSDVCLQIEKICFFQKKLQFDCVNLLHKELECLDCLIYSAN